MDAFATVEGNGERAWRGAGPHPALHGSHVPVRVLGGAPAPAAAVALRRADRLGAAHGRARGRSAHGLPGRSGERGSTALAAVLRHADRLAAGGTWRVRTRVPRSGRGAAARAGPGSGAAAAAAS